MTDNDVTREIPAVQDPDNTQAVWLAALQAHRPAIDADGGPLGPEGRMIGGPVDADGYAIDMCRDCGGMGCVTCGHTGDRKPPAIQNDARPLPLVPSTEELPAEDFAAFQQRWTDTAGYPSVLRRLDTPPVTPPAVDEAAPGRTFTGIALEVNDDGDLCQRRPDSPRAASDALVALATEDLAAGAHWAELATATAELATGVRDLMMVALAGRVPPGDWTVPTSPFVPLIEYTVRNGSEGVRRTEVDRVAAALGVQAAADYPDVELQHATYAAERKFGPVTYRVQTHLDAPPLPSAAEADIDWEAARRDYAADALPRSVSPAGAADQRDVVDLVGVEAHLADAALPPRPRRLPPPPVPAGASRRARLVRRGGTNRTKVTTR